MNRIFFFGCSYTHFAWPTWADILGISVTGYRLHRPEVQNRECVSYNFGLSGCSNSAIIHRILTAHAQFNFDAGDTVCVQWTSKYRHSIARTMVEHDRLDYDSPDYSVSHCFWQEVTAKMLLNRLRANTHAHIFEFDFDYAEADEISDVTDYDTGLLECMISHNSGNHSWQQLAQQGGYDAHVDEWYNQTKHIDAHPSPYQHACVASAVLHQLNGGKLDQYALDHSQAAQDLLQYGWDNSQLPHMCDADVDDLNQHEQWQNLTQVVRKSYVEHTHCANSMECMPSEAGDRAVIQRLLNGK